MALSSEDDARRNAERLQRFWDEEVEICKQANKVKGAPKVKTNGHSSNITLFSYLPSSNTHVLVSDLFFGFFEPRVSPLGPSRSLICRFH